jgi:hypothetical protein
MADMKKDDELLYILQLTDSATGSRCAMKIDPGKFNSFHDLFNQYVKVTNEQIMTSESAKDLGVIQDSIYNIDDDGELLDFYEGLIVRQDNDIVNMHDKPEFQLAQSAEHPDVMLLDITIDRSQITEDGNPYGYNIRKWKKDRPVFERFIQDCLDQEYKAAADRILELNTIEDRKRFLRAVGKKIWDSDFELYSRFIGDRIWFKDSAETLHNIIAGRGGTCAEKCSAMKLISDAYGFKSDTFWEAPEQRDHFQWMLFAGC